MAAHGLVLFGHGARDARWREPFERLAEKLRAARASNGDDGLVRLAFLELMQPDLPTAVGQLVAVGCDVVTVVPVFFGQGADRAVSRVAAVCGDQVRACGWRG
jgi:sirohydrochlorin cobaltochelatase